MKKNILPILFITLLIDMIGTGMVFPIIPIIFTDPSSPSFLLKDYSQSSQFLIAGLVTAVFGIMQFAAAPILGELSDIYGRKKLLALGIAVLAVSQMIFAVGIELKVVWLLILSRAVAGLAAANFSIAQAAIADVTEPKDRAKNFGMIGAAFGLGFIIGPLLGGWIAGFTQNASSPFWIAGFLGIINLIYCIMLLPETHKNRAAATSIHILKGIRNLQKAYLDKSTRFIYLSSFLYMSGFTFLTSFSGIFLVERFSYDAAAIGTYFAVIGLFVIITQAGILPVLSKKYGEIVILRFSLFILALSVGIFPFMPNTISNFILVPFIAVPQGLAMANLSALISKKVSAQKQGAALGINGSLIAFSSGTIPLLAGFGSGYWGLKSPFIAGMILILAAWILLLIKIE